MSKTATISAPHQTHALMGRLADRWRSAGLFIASYSPDGRLLWHDSHMPKTILLAAHEYAVGNAVRAASNSPEPYLNDALPDNHRPPAKTPVSPLYPFPGIQLRLTPIARRRKVTGWLAVFARTGDVALSEEFHRACGNAGQDAAALLAQARRIPLVAEASLPTLAVLAGQMHEDMVNSTVSQGDLAGVAEELSGVYEELSILCKISDGMRFSQKPQPFLETVCQELQAIGNFRAVAIGLVQRRDDANPVITDLATFVGDCPIQGRELVNALHAPIHKTLAGGQTTVHNDNSAASDFATIRRSIQRFVCVPLVRDNRPLGIMLALDKNDGTEITSVDLTLLNNVGNQCSIFLENASLYQDMQDLFMGVLHALTHSIDAKDAYTRGHSQRVAELSRALARKIGLPEEQCERVYLSGLLHDIGKIGVPEAVLTKPGRLTDAEFEAIKKHPAIGAEILANIKQLQDIIPGVLYHHERWDAKGYPYNLAGENIPLIGRIICVADSFDAMSSTRTYRPALPLETVLHEILRCAGTQFDPALAAAFVTLDFEPYKKSIEEHLTFRQLPGAEISP